MACPNEVYAAKSALSAALSLALSAALSLAPPPPFPSLHRRPAALRYSPHLHDIMEFMDDDDDDDDNSDDDPDFSPRIRKVDDDDDSFVEGDDREEDPETGETALVTLGDRLGTRPSYMRAIKQEAYRKDASMPAATYVTTGILAEALPGMRLAATNEVVAFPVASDNAVERIRRLCEPAPFGRGTETVVDEAVRKTWQLHADAFVLTNPAFVAGVAAAVAAVAMDFGLPAGAVEHVLHKFLLYEPGSFFAPHRDSEKAPGMFATLVVELPSVYTGGALYVHNGNATKAFAYGDGFRTHYVAFYADCVHEFKPVQSGHRAVLTYNLLFKPQEITAATADVRREHGGSAPALPPMLTGSALLQPSTLYDALRAWHSDGGRLHQQGDAAGTQQASPQPQPPLPPAAAQAADAPSAQVHPLQHGAQPAQGRRPHHRRARAPRSPALRAR